MYQILFDNKKQELEDCHIHTTFKTAEELANFLSKSEIYIIAGMSEREFPLFYNYNDNKFSTIQIMLDDKKIYDSSDCILGECEIDLIGGYAAHGFSKGELLELLQC